MYNHFLRFIEIQNFKCFSEFKADEFKRVNLISGVNNIGKTSFMEASFVNLRANNLECFVGVLHEIRYMRENLNILEGALDDVKEFIEQNDNIYTKSNINQASFSVINQDDLQQYIFEFNKQYIKINSSEFLYEMDYVPNINFIDSSGLSDGEIIQNYATIQKTDDENFINLLLNEFDENIEAFKVIDDKPFCKIGEDYIHITDLGNGTRHILSIITAIYQSKYGTLFIDDIESCIDPSLFKKLWSMMLQLSLKLEVQLFATTHSKECIDVFVYEAEALDDTDITHIELYKTLDGKIMADIKDFEILSNTTKGV